MDGGDGNVAGHPDSAFVWLVRSEPLPRMFEELGNAGMFSNELLQFSLDEDRPENGVVADSDPIVS